MKRYLFILLFVMSISGVLAIGTSGFGNSFGGNYISSSSFIVRQSYQPTFQNYYTASDIATYWPQLNNQDSCEGRQDLMLNVPIGGCQPAVVRSDILADQNFPVFCQIDAFQINPLINIKEISNIRFTGKYPNEVVATGFHPARAALNTRDQLLGDPLMNNIGYVVVVLKRNQNESSLPDFVNVTLSAQIEYKSGNSLGIGTNEFVLKEQSDQEWEVDGGRNKQSFWQGRYFVRLESVDANNARVAIYYGDKKLTSVLVRQGETSKEIYAPGFYCQAGLQVQYVGSEFATDKATLEIGDGATTDRLDVYKGSNILNGRCTVTDLVVNADGETGYVDVSCPSEKIRLQLRNNFNVTDRVVIINSVSSGTYSFFGSQSYSTESYEIVSPVTGSTVMIQKIENGKRVGEPSPYPVSQLMLDPRVKTTNQKSNKEQVLSDEAEREFSSAIAYYERVANDYPAEKETEVSQSTYAEQALSEAITLSESLGKYETSERLMRKYVDKYPNGVQTIYYKNRLDTFYLVDPSLSGKSVSIDNGYKSISLVSMERASKKASATFLYDGKQYTLNYYVNQGSFGTNNLAGNFADSKIWIDTRNGQWVPESVAQPTTQGSGYSRSNYCYIQLSGMQSDRVDISTDCKSDRRTLLLNEVARINENKNLVLTNVNLESSTRIRIIPNVKGTRTETNLSVYIGIEKRAIQLAPEKTKNMIISLNKSIADWEKISKAMTSVISGLKAACFATSAVLTVKNFISGIDGTSLAREQAMTGAYGWEKICKEAVAKGTITRPDGKSEAVNYKSITECFNEEKDNINKEVDCRANVLTNEVNKKIKEIENSAGITVGSLASGTTVDSKKASGEYLSYLQDKCKSDYSSYSICTTINSLKLPGSYESDKQEIPYSYVDLREMHYNLELIKTKCVDTTKTLDELKKRIDKQVSISSALSVGANVPGGVVKAEQTAKVGLLADGRPARGTLFDISKTGIDYKIGEAKLVTGNADLTGVNAGMFIQGAKVDKATGNLVKSSIADKYLIVGNRVDATLNPKTVYAYTESSGTIIISDSVYASNIAQFSADYGVSTFQDNGITIYNNPINRADQVVRYFETGPDKGLAAYVPFDLTRGWYARVDSNLRIGNQVPVYDASGLPRSWKICNVGADGGSDETDTCTSVFDSSTQISGLDATQSKTLFDSSRRALLDANAQKGSKFVTLSNGARLSQGAPVSSISSVNCQTFMSADDCKLLFNVCDPVICPATRCNLGGQYNVADVIQTGVVGSALLCLPNYKEGVAIPVCLTGIQAGLDSYISVLKNHRDCLQSSLNTGNMVGICDQIYSIYACQFFWDQVAPVANVMVPKLLEAAQGQGARGGGEYLATTKAWDNAKASVDYFTQTYAVNSFKAFQARNIQEAGGEFCKAYVSAASPKSFKTLLEPDSPPQFYAYFDSFQTTSATVPATAQYKVFYHVFGGKDSGVSYSVYLKDPPEASYYASAPYVQVASGFIPKGQYASQTKDFTAPEGYKTLCVRINAEEKCGFKQVSTDFAVNYARDLYIQEQATANSVTTEKDCISGTASPLALLSNPNAVSAGEEAGLPQIYNRGVIRVCSTGNPGLATNPSRYVEVGYCDRTDLKCWVDKNSVSNAITDANAGVRNATLNELKSIADQRLQDSGVTATTTEISGFLQEVENVKKTFTLAVARELTTRADNIVSRISEISLGFAHQKAQVLLAKAQVQSLIAKDYFSKYKKNVVTPTTTTPTTAGTTTTTTTQTQTQPQPTTTNTQPQPQPQTPTNVYSLGINYDPIFSTALRLNGNPTEVFFLGSKVYYQSDLNQIGTITGTGPYQINILSSKTDFVYLNGATIDGKSVTLKSN